VVDATQLPFPDGALANIFMIDVLHHLEAPIRFFDEAVRTLAPGGRVILVEPYVSPVSWLAWKLFVDERCDTRADPFCGAGARTGGCRDPWQANIAIPTQLFFRRLVEFESRFPQLRVVERRRLDMLVMPLSGGFEKPRLIPLWLVPLARALESKLAGLQALLAFRCLVVLERI
jgi:SAM-dependent methyltransferase